MLLLEEVKQLIKERLGEGYHNLVIDRLVIGIFFTGVKLSNGSGGICYTPIKDIPDAVCCPSSAGKIFHPEMAKGEKADVVLSGIFSREPLKVALGIATLNALSSTCFHTVSKDRYKILRNMDALDAISIPVDGSVALIGAMIPVMKRLKMRGGTWWVIEKDPRVLRSDEMDHYVPVEGANDILNNADVLIITGATLVSQTLEGILDSAKPHAEIAVIGPTASMLPDPFFKRGVRVIGGVLVTHPDELLDTLVVGGSGYHFFNKSADRIVIENGVRE